MSSLMHRAADGATVAIALSSDIKDSVALKWKLPERTSWRFPYLSHFLSIFLCILLILCQV